jgi:hypothetical protein
MDPGFRRRGNEMMAIVKYFYKCGARKMRLRSLHRTLHSRQEAWLDWFRHEHRAFTAKKRVIIEVRRGFKIMLDNGAVWPGARRAVPKRLKAVGLRVFVGRYAARADLIVRRQQFLARVRQHRTPMRTV